MDNIKFLDTYNYICQHYEEIKAGETVFYNTKLAKQKNRKDKFLIAGFIFLLMMPSILFSFFIYFSAYNDDFSILVNIVLSLVFGTMLGVGFISIFLSIFFSDEISNNEPKKISEKDLKVMKSDVLNTTHPFSDFISENMNYLDYTNLDKYLNLKKYNISEIFTYYFSKLSPKEYFDNEKDILSIFKNDKRIFLSGKKLKILEKNYFYLYKNNFLDSDDINNRIELFFNLENKNFNKDDLDKFSENLKEKIQSKNTENKVFTNILNKIFERKKEQKTNYFKNEHISF